MNEPINANAVYIKVMHNNGKFTLIDMNDIVRIGLGEKVQFEGLDTQYTVAVIDWKQPYTDQWQVFIDNDGLELWKDFCSKPQKSVDK